MVAATSIVSSWVPTMLGQDSIIACGVLLGPKATASSASIAIMLWVPTGLAHTVFYLLFLPSLAPPVTWGSRRPQPRCEPGSVPRSPWVAHSESARAGARDPNPRQQVVER